MAIQSGTFTFSLPEDIDTDQLIIYSSSTKDGTYALAATVSYEYGVISYEYDSLDDTLWYKIKFNNSVESEAGALSDAVYGGDFANASPFLAVSTSTDGAFYATVQDVYDYTNLTSEDVTSSQISTALKRARAVIDLRTAELDLDRYDMYGLYNIGTARKKYNATLRIVREAEINIALGNVYRGLADDLIVKNLRETLSGSSSGSSSVSIGSTSISGSDGLQNTAHVNSLNGVADRYFMIGGAMLESIKPTSVRLHPGDEFRRWPRFRYPFNGF